MNEQAQISRIVAFIESVGIPVLTGEITQPTFLPGIMIERGQLVVDWARLSYPGDLLHEAGHIAVMLPEQRLMTAGTVGDSPGDELAAICWSYAAAQQLQVDARVVFHSQGYKNDGDWLADIFTQGTYIGLPLLEWMGLTVGNKRAAETGVAAYPHMLRWLRE